jgi:hypothetical protein
MVFSRGGVGQLGVRPGLKNQDLAPDARMDGDVKVICGRFARLMEKDNRMLTRIALAAAALTLASCGKEEPPKPVDPGTKVEQAARQLGEAARQGDVNQAGEAMKRMGEALSGSVGVEPVDFRKLRDLLPASIAGLKRTAAEGSRTNVVGIASSKAQATYEDGKGGRIVLEITDVGTLSGVTAMAFAWVNVEIDKEGTSGYERTTTVNGRKAYERYDSATRTGELDVIVAGRFIVGAKATGVEMKVFREAVEKLDLAKLDALKSEGLPRAAPEAQGK